MAENTLLQRRGTGIQFENSLSNNERDRFRFKVSISSISFSQWSKHSSSCFRQFYVSYVTMSSVPRSRAASMRSISARPRSTQTSASEGSLSSASAHRVLVQVIALGDAASEYFSAHEHALRQENCRVGSCGRPLFPSTWVHIEAMNISQILTMQSYTELLPLFSLGIPLCETVRDYMRQGGSITA